MTPKTPPAAWDRHALEVARGIASLDRSKIPPAQFTAIVQEAIVDAMMMAADASKPLQKDIEEAHANLELSRTMILREMAC